MYLQLMDVLISIQVVVNPNECSKMCPFIQFWNPLLSGVLRYPRQSDPFASALGDPTRVHLISVSQQHAKSL